MLQLDQTVKTPTFQSLIVAQQYANGLLSRLEADIFDVLDAQGLFASLVVQHVTDGYHHSHPLLQSQLHLRCYEDTLPLLHQWVSQFLAGRHQRDLVILGATVHSRETGVVPYEERGRLIIGSPLVDLHRTLAERLAEHLFAEGQITSYSHYGANDAATCSLQTQ